MYVSNKLLLSFPTMRISSFEAAKLFRLKMTAFGFQVFNLYMNPSFTLSHEPFP